MEPLIEKPGTSKGLEILYFEKAELQRSYAGQASIVASGPLNVLYFNDYHRCFLRIKDWIYPLMRRLPIVGIDKTDATSTRCYCLPCLNGSCYNLRVECFGSGEAFENFETILQECSLFTWKGESHHGYLEKSPDDKLVRYIKQETGVKEMITEGIKHLMAKIGTGSQPDEKLCKEISDLRHSNLNMLLPRTYHELIKTSDSQTLSLYLPTLQLEETILDYRDLASQGTFNVANWFEQKPGLAESIQQGLHEIKELVLQPTETTKGLEVLYFEKAELQKSKYGEAYFVTSGPLSVLYVKDYHRFFLRINDWIYPLMKRLPIVGMDKVDATSSHAYCLPGPHSYCYNLKLESFGSGEAFENFEAILQECSKFSWRGEIRYGHLEESPDDKLARHLKQETEGKEVIPESLKHHIQMMKTKMEGLGEKFSKDFVDLRHSNINMILPRTYDELLKTNESQVPSLCLPKLKLEEIILDYRDIASQGNLNLGSWFEQKPSLAKSIQEGLHEVMELVLQQPETAKGLEVLYFEKAELQKCKDGKSCSVDSGPLSVLYFKDYQRFFLHINDWIYPLMRRLPIVGMDKTDGTSSRVYCLPGCDDFCYNLRVDCFGSGESFENFEAILQECSKFSWKGEVCHGHLEQSPDDKLVRHLKQEVRLKEIIAGGLKQGIRTLKTKLETPSQSGGKLSEEILKLRDSNINMLIPRSYEDIVKTEDSQVPSLYLPTLDLEETILDYRDVASQGKFNLTNWFEQKPNLAISNVSRGREKVADRSRNLNPNQIPEQVNLGEIPKQTAEH